MAWVATAKLVSDPSISVPLLPHQFVYEGTIVQPIKGLKNGWERPQIPLQWRLIRSW